MAEPEVITRDDAPNRGEASSPTEITVAADILPITVHLLPLTQRPFFPIQAMPIVIPEEPWFDTIVRIGESPQKVAGLVLIQPGAEEPPKSESFHPIGTAVRIHKPQREEGRIQFVAEGIQRFRIVKWIATEIPYLAQVEYLDEDVEADDQETKAYAMAILAAIKGLVPLNPLLNEELKLYLERFSPNQPAFLAYFAANLTTAPGEELQDILSLKTLMQRLVRVLELLHRELDVAKLQTRIRQQVEERMTRQQREFFLREQLKAIQKELGIEKDDRTAEIDRFRERLAALDPSDDARRRIEEEIDKMAILEAGSPEYAVTRNYLEWITSLPWGQFSEDILDLERAREILDVDHTGLDDVKDRIVEFLAVGKLRGTIEGSILLLVGPPGVGKTSIGRSVAAAIGRKFFRFSVGGMRDEAEIKGHRRTYIGAMPGKFIQALKDVEVANPVLMLDEIDKVGASYQGDSRLGSPRGARSRAEQRFSRPLPRRALRSVAGPVHLHCEPDRLDCGPAARSYGGHSTVGLHRRREGRNRQATPVAPRQLEHAGLKSRQLRITDAALKKVVENYARESGGSRARQAARSHRAQGGGANRSRGSRENPGQTASTSRRFSASRCFAGSGRFAGSA